MGAPASISNSTSQDVILFDGVCNLCNGAVRFVVQRDPKKRYKFSPLQSSLGQAILKNNTVNTSLYSIVLIRDHKVYERSAAVLEIVRYLSGIWPAFYVFKIIPRFMRDALYSFVAKHRYTIFGRTEFCMIPTPELQQRFLNESVSIDQLSDQI